VIIRLEKGDHRVGFGTVAAAARVMGLQDRLLDAFAPVGDPVAEREARLNLPERVRKPRPEADPEMDF
jgi:hypothetical protein